MGLPRRRRAKRAGLALALIGALAPACGPDSSSTTETPGAGGGSSLHPGTTTDYVTMVAQGFCAAIFHCVIPSDDVIAQRIEFGTEERCLSVALRGLSGGTNASKQFTDLDRLVNAGAVHQDASALQRCMSAITQGCDPGALDSVADCRAIFSGTLAPGAACHRTEQCAGDAYCDSATGGDRCGGTCTPRKAAGAPCSESNECSAANGGVGLCARDPAGSGQYVCVSGSGGAGAVGQGGTCVYSGGLPSERCAAGLFCDRPLDSTGTRSPTGTCRPPIALGAACDSGDDPCVPGAYCFGRTGAKTCQTVTLSQELQSCARSDTTFTYCDYFSGLTCDETTEKCVRTGDGSLGARCDTTDAGDLIPCQSGLYCDGTLGTCQPVKHAGEACDTDSQCDVGRCDTASQKCLAYYCTN